MEYMMDWVGETWTQGGVVQVGVFSAAYFVFVQVATSVMDNNPSWDFKQYTKLPNSIHNMLMSVLSAYMFFGALPQVWNTFQETDKTFNDLVICDDKEILKKGQEYWFWWFFVSKFLEFIDTVFLILNRKHSPSAGWYLQVYHHSTTASVAWVAWFYNVPNAWFGLMSNTFVHIVMYFYFAVVVYDRRVRVIGHFVTYIQLIQFYCVVGSAFYSQFMTLVLNYECDDSYFGRMYVTVIYASYLVFFLVFHKARTKTMKVGSKKKGGDEGGAKDEGDGKGLCSGVLGGGDGDGDSSGGAVGGDDDQSQTARRSTRLRNKASKAST